MENYNYGVPGIPISIQTTLGQFYLDHLNKLYCVYSHLEERFSELIENALFEDQESIINTLIQHAESQLRLLEQLYQVLKQEPSFDFCQGLTHFLEDNFKEIHKQRLSKELSNSLISSYLQYSSSIIEASLQILQISTLAFFTIPAVKLIAEIYQLSQKENLILISKS